MSKEGIKKEYRISNHEYRMSKEGILSIFIKKAERSDSILRNSAVHHSAVLRFAVQSS